MLGLTKSRYGDPYRKYQTRWALWKVALAGLIFVAICGAAIYALNLETYTSAGLPQQTTGSATQGK